MTVVAVAELSRTGRKVQWRVRDQRVVQILRTARAEYVGPDKGGPYWKLPLDYALLKGVIGRIGHDRVTIGPVLAEWAWQERAQIEALQQLLTKDNARLPRLRTELPDLYATLRPDQRIGIAFCTLVDNPLLADEMGLGKTLEAIGTAFESGSVFGRNLIICPKTSAESVWRYELERWQPFPAYDAASLTSKGAREAVIDIAMAEHGPMWLIINPAMLRGEAFKRLHTTVWTTIAWDEISDGGMRHVDSQTAKGGLKLRTAETGKRIAMTGTPWGGKTINGWGILHWLEPKKYSSKWNWAWQWLEVNHNGFGYEIGEVRRGLEDAFDEHLATIMIGRPKSSVLKNLPPKQYIDVWVDMTPAQRRQYIQFAKMAEVYIGETQLTATSLLAEYTRLKQFAGAVQDVKEVKDGTVHLTALPESGKLTKLEDDFVALGILDRNGAGHLSSGGDTEQQAVVGSQFGEMVDMLYDHFVAMGLPCMKMTGETKKRADVQRSFQRGEARVMFMTTATGGVSITLDRASNVFIMDEMWDPDKQRQLEDRCHRASRIHQVTVRYYRSRGTVEEYISRVTGGGQAVNDAIQAGQVRLWGI